MPFYKSIPLFISVVPQQYWTRSCKWFNSQYCKRGLKNQQLAREANTSRRSTQSCLHILISPKWFVRETAGVTREVKRGSLKRVPPLLFVSTNISRNMATFPALCLKIAGKNRNTTKNKIKGIFGHVLRFTIGYVISVKCSMTTRRHVPTYRSLAVAFMSVCLCVSRANCAGACVYSHRTVLETLLTVRPLRVFLSVEQHMAPGGLFANKNKVTGVSEWIYVHRLYSQTCWMQFWHNVI